MNKSDLNNTPSRPVVGVGVVVWRNDQVLLIRRGKEPRKGEWSIPGGSQGFGETLHQAACREVLEETGLAVQILELVGVVDGIMKDESGQVTHHYTLVDFAARAVAGSGEPIPGDDAVEARWFELDQLDSLGMWAETRKMIEQSRQALANR